MMNAITDPLERVVETMQWFMTAPEIRVVHIVTSEPLRLTVLEHVAAMEHFATNRAPFVILEAPVEPNDGGWETRSEELREDMADLRARLIDAPPAPPLSTQHCEAPAPPLHEALRSNAELERGLGGEVGEVGEAAPTRTNADASFGGFALTLKAATECLDEPLNGLVVVLSPLSVHDRSRWAEDVGALVAHSAFRTRVRWVIVDMDVPACSAIADKLGNAALSVDARIHGAAMKKELAAMVDAVDSAPDGAMGVRLGGFAGPDEAPPPRKGKPRPLTPDEAEKVAAEHGVPTAYLLVKPMHELRKCILQAGAAMADGHADVAVGKTREARAIATSNKLHKEATMMTLMMGGYALQGRALDTAAALFREAKQHADARGFVDLSVQAQMSLAACLFASNKLREAALAYAESGQLAAAADQRVMAIEAYRTSGQLLVTLRDDYHAAQAFLRACQISGQGFVEEWCFSSAPEAARALAKVFAAHEHYDDAALMLRLAEEMETMGESEANREEVCHAS